MFVRLLKACVLGLAALTLLCDAPDANALFRHRGRGGSVSVSFPGGVGAVPGSFPLRGVHGTCGTTTASYVRSSYIAPASYVNYASYVAPASAYVQYVQQSYAPPVSYVQVQQSYVQPPQTVYYQQPVLTGMSVVPPQTTPPPQPAPAPQPCPCVCQTQQYVQQPAPAPAPQPCPAPASAPSYSVPALGYAPQPAQTYQQALAYAPAYAQSYAPSYDTGYASYGTQYAQGDVAYAYATPLFDVNRYYASGHYHHHHHLAAAAFPLAGFPAHGVATLQRGFVPGGNFSRSASVQLAGGGVITADGARRANIVVRPNGTIRARGR
jgi:hypothetical protein